MSAELAKQSNAPGVLASLASTAQLEPKQYYAAIKSMCGCDGARDEHFLALMMQSQKLGLDPMLRQLYLMKTRKGVQVVVPIDGYLKLMHAHPEYVSHEVEYGESPTAGPWCQIRIWTKPMLAAKLNPPWHREYLEECRLGTGPWKSHPHRMLKHKAMSQAVRYTLGDYVPDPDEWERMSDVMGVRDADDELPPETTANVALPLPPTGDPEEQPPEFDFDEAEDDGEDYDFSSMEF